MNARNQAARTTVSLVVLCAVVGLGLNACTTSMRSNGIGTAQPTAYTTEQKLQQGLITPADAAAEEPKLDKPGMGTEIIPAPAD